MNHIKQLAGQTAVYGMGIVLPRLLNYLLLTPFYTRVFTKAEYGIITELYAYVVFLIVILTYGMETGFFRYAEGRKTVDNVYRTSLVSVFTTSLAFIAIVSVFNERIAGIIDYQDTSQYILWLAIIVSLDAFTAIPFARIRFENKAFRYAVIRIVEVSVNILANWFFIYYCDRHYENSAVIQKIYNPDIRVGYVLISNLLASSVKTILLIPEIFRLKGAFQFTLLKKILNYSFPLLVAGLAGTVNEAIDRVLLKYRLPDSDTALEQLGVYGANFKLAVLMTLFIQMFRYAAEPFFFSKKNEKNAKTIYADVMKFFIFFCMIIFIGVTLFMDIFKYFIGESFRDGLDIVPIILMANLFMGVFYNLSVWYKLTNRTRFGAILVFTGAIITFLVNYFFIPEFGYQASAWGHFISYLVMITLSYLLGAKYYKINYDLKNIFFYIAFGLGIYLFFNLISLNNLILLYGLKILFLAGYIIFFLYREEILKKYFLVQKTKKHGSKSSQ
ncbi:MAG: polysaccharide biosynthesis C-terminal domain-containing protein [Bacteroidales bacterium]